MSPNFLRYSLPMLMPLAIGWVERQERRILAKGCPLPPELLDLAKEAGVSDPSKIRVECVQEVPWPSMRVLKQAGVLMGLRLGYTAGLSARWGIYLKADTQENIHILMHEVVHTVQYERLGGIRPFLEKYLEECIEFGYSSSPMEIEAREEAVRLIKSAPGLSPHFVFSRE